MRRPIKVRHRGKVKRRVSKKLFRESSRTIKKQNIKPRPMRGGIRL